MKKYSFYLFAFLLLFGNYTNAQVLKKYSGSYQLSLPSLDVGNAGYSYQEKEMKKILHGKFSLSVKSKDDNKGFIQKISGNYKNGFRDGKWLFVITLTDWMMPGYHTYKTGTCTLSVNYKSGQPDGTWVYSSSVKSREKIKLKEKESFSAYSKPVAESVKMVFNKGVLTVFNYELPDVNKKEAVKISYSFDESGYINGVVEEKNNIKSDTKWYHGLKNPAEEDKSRIEKFLAYNKNCKDSLKYLPYSFKTIKLNENKVLNAQAKNQDIQELLSKVYSSYFLWDDIPGDINYDTSGVSSEPLQHATITGFYAREKMDQVPVEKVLPAEQTSLFEKINKQTLALSALLNDAKIVKCSGIEEAKTVYDAAKKYLDTITVVQHTIHELEKFYKGTGPAKPYTSIVENSFFLKDIKEPDILLFTVSRLASIEQSMHPVLSELDIYYKKYEFQVAREEGDSFIKQKNYDAATKAFQRALFMEPDDPGTKLKLEEIKNLEAIAEAEGKRVKIFAYLVENFRKIPANFKYGEEKKNLYEAYLVMKDYLLREIDNPVHDAFKKLEFSNEAVKFVDKMNELLTKNTEDIEKQLKKVKEPAEIKKILGL